MQAQGRTSGFLKIESIQSGWSTDSASEGYSTYILNSLVSEPGILAVMHRRNWICQVLAEYDPKRVNVKSVSVACHGFHRHYDGGKSDIYLVLRNMLTAATANPSLQFRSYEDIRTTLFHELAHYVHSDHSEEFYKLMDEITQEALAFELSLQPRKLSFNATTDYIIALNGGAVAHACVSNTLIVVRSLVDMLGSLQSDKSILPIDEGSQVHRLDTSSSVIAGKVWAVDGGQELLRGIGLRPHMEAPNDVFVCDDILLATTFCPWVIFKLRGLLASGRIVPSSGCDKTTEGESRESPVSRIPTPRERLAQRNRNRQASSSRKMHVQEFLRDSAARRRRSSPHTSSLDGEPVSNSVQDSHIAPDRFTSAFSQLMEFARPPLWTSRVTCWDILVLLLPGLMYYTAEESYDYRSHQLVKSETWKFMAIGVIIYFVTNRIPQIRAQLQARIDHRGKKLC
ncbi:WLM domain-containing protein [Gaertneriomyces semiglobifer]|nr:WLM domain-containing protein [Gaertneriomyces semiglobifer]